MSIQNNIRESGTALNPGASGQGHREENGAMRTQTGFLESLTSAVRDNPVAAALIGGGALWLLMDSDKLKGAVNSGAAAASPMVDIGARNLRSAASRPRRTSVQPTAPEMDHEGSFRVGDTLREAGNAASDTMSGAADKIRDRFDEGVAYARENLGKLGPGKESLAKAQSSLADILERQPLVLGAIGLAIGAAVAGAFRTSDLENEWIGDLSDEVKADLNTRAGAVSQSLREASDTLQAEFSERGPKRWTG